jgi:septal ring factor EnvC (AmiA/AmiB activator)
MLGMSNDSNDFTQKDLMKHLLDTAQHAATRGNLQAAEANLGHRIERVQDELGQVRNELKHEIADIRTDLKAEIKEVRTKIDRMTWAICGTIVVAAVTMIFKDVLLAGLIS